MHLINDAIILAPIGRDATVASGILREQGLTGQICTDVNDCVDRFASACCLIVTDEALLNENRSRLAEWVGAQPPWSEFPVILLTSRGGGLVDTRLNFLSEYAVTLERPFSPQALVAAVRSAVRARRRQLEVKTLLDERDRSDERQRLLIRELHHRVKNTLANVQAVLGATARSSATIDAFYRTFSARVQSLARTHTFLTDDYWQTASLSDILAAELGHYNDSERIQLQGPEVSLNADQAVPLGMAFHELATNSVKYGALSIATGVLEIDWTVISNSDGDQLSLTWRERGGPRVETPTRKGFGSMLFERVLTVQLGAEVTMDYSPSGLSLALCLPLIRDRLVPQYNT